MSDDTRPPVAIAVVSWNTSSLLERCLESLHDDAAAGVAEVWVVDNASSDDSADLVRLRFPWATLVESSENLGFGAAVNLVAARTRSTWIAAANADTRLHSAALTALVQEGRRRPDVGVVAPRLILPDGTTQHSAYPFPTLTFTLAYLSGLTRFSRRAARRWCIGRGFDPDLKREIPWAVGAFLLIRRSAWDEIGGFDERQWMYAEDLDLGWRLARAGWKALYVAEARVDHAESAATSQAWGGERYARWHQSTYAWMLRRRGAPYTRLIATANVLGFLARAAILWPAALTGRAASIAARQSALNAARSHRVGLSSRRALEHVR